MRKSAIRALRRPIAQKRNTGFWAPYCAKAQYGLCCALLRKSAIRAFGVALPAGGRKGNPASAIASRRLAIRLRGAAFGKPMRREGAHARAAPRRRAAAPPKGGKYFIINHARLSNSCNRSIPIFRFSGIFSKSNMTIVNKSSGKSATYRLMGGGGH